jgi:CRP-like cAMP-binding protein
VEALSRCDDSLSFGTRHNQSTRLALPTPKQNHILASLPKAEYESLLPHLTPVQFQLGRTVYRAGDCQNYVYFPATTVMSLHVDLQDGSSVEGAIVGNDGVVGIATFMGGESTPFRAMVQSAGYSYRLKGQLLKNQFVRGGFLQCLLLHYTQALITQMAQTAVCNRHHSVDQQLCHRLLSCLDRMPSNKLVMTQELIANTMGLSLRGVVEAAGHLQAAGLIEYSRGKITVLDRTKLEARVCECYSVVKREYNRLIPLRNAL